MRFGVVFLLFYGNLACLSAAAGQTPDAAGKPADSPATSTLPESKPQPPVAAPGATPIRPEAPGATAKVPAAATADGGAPVDPNSYVIGPEDVIAVRVWREPDLSGSFSVRPDGKISLPLVNEVQAGGLTPQQLTVSVTDRLTKFINRPEVNISIQAVNSKKYFIAGEAARTGAFAMPVPMTVLEALIGAGGFREFASTKKIYILRGTQRFRFNYNQVIKGKHMEQNIALQNGDKIVVP